MSYISFWSSQLQQLYPCPAGWPISGTYGNIWLCLLLNALQLVDVVCALGHREHREHSALFITLQESHLHTGVLDAEINIPENNSHRTDRTCRKNGGVITYIRKDIAVKKELSHSNSFCEISAQNIPKLRLCLSNHPFPGDSPPDSDLPAGGGGRGGHAQHNLDG